MSNFGNSVDNIDLAHDTALAFNQVVDARVAISQPALKPAILIEEGSQGKLLSTIQNRVETNQPTDPDSLAEVTEMAMTSAEYESLAKRDLLTGVYDRRGLDDRLLGSIDEVRRSNLSEGLAVVLFDAVSFKEYNDTFGYPQGDVLIQTIAGSVGDEIRRADTLARYGGDEFVAVLPTRSLEQANTSVFKERRSNLGEDGKILPGILEAANAKLAEQVRQTYLDKGLAVPDKIPGQLRAMMLFITPERIKASRSVDALIAAINDEITQAYMGIKTEGR